MFEYATMILVGKVICFQEDGHGAGFMKVSVARKSVSGKINKSVFIVNISKASWGYYTKYLHKGMKIKAILEMYRNEFLDDEQKHREKSFGLATKIEQVREVEEVPVDDQDEKPDNGNSTTGTASHKFSFEDALPPSGYSPF